MGSGTTAVVAAGLGRDFIGIEKSPKYCEVAMQRLERNKTNSEVAKFHQPTFFTKPLGKKYKPSKSMKNEQSIEIDF